ncbi:glycoside hydrolase family 5 protein [Nocardia beijingensis]|uniref:Glycoside hydrolase family 5 protein n=1 Tax=Nocardia beijingensis TaxID=95162 RepID=A0ABW7WPG2_9NOCA
MTIHSIHDVSRLLARTINAGLDFGAEGEAGWTIDLTEVELDLFVSAGFTAVRMGVYWAAHTGPGPEFVIDSWVLDRVAFLLDRATERGLAVVLTNFLDPELIADPPAHLPRLLAITGQVAARFADRPESVVLEPFTEPRGALDPLWNRYLRELLAVVRDADPDRAVVVGPGAYNNIRMLPQLSLPADDRRIIVTLHQYWPITFTMQGEEWLGADTPFGDPRSWLGTTWEGTQQQRAELADAYEAVANWAAAQGRPIFIGEFGTSTNADSPSRARWTEFNRRRAEFHEFSWGYWSFAPSFALYDRATATWNTPLLHALMDQ